MGWLDIENDNNYKNKADFSNSTNSPSRAFCLIIRYDFGVNHFSKIFEKLLQFS